MASSRDIMQRYRGLPRAAKWAIWAGAALLGYLAVDELVLAPWQQLRAEAETARAKLESYQKSAQNFESAESAIALGVSRVGDLREPPPESEGADALRRQIGEILRARGLDGFTLRQTGGERLAPGAPAEVVESTEAISKVRFELSVQGPAMQVLGALADLERSPIVSAVRHVRLRKEEGGDLSATIVPEVWTIAEEGAA